MATRVGVGCLEIGHHPRESGHEPFLERRWVGRPVTREHDLPVRLVERIERVEELLLRALLAGQELDVVDQEHVRGAVAALELQRGRVLDGVDHLVHELLGGDEHDPRARALRPHRVADRVHEVGLAEADAAGGRAVVALAGIRATAWQTA
jgi:hypothetical protein